MNYLEIYKNLVEIAKNRILLENETYEKHHIIPKCIFDFSYSKLLFNNYYNMVKSKYSKCNLVKLTLREHYVSHLLLVRIFENDKNCYNRLLCAANFLTTRTKNNREYKWQKIEYIKQLKISMTGKPSKAKGKKWTEEAKKNKSGINHCMYNKTYDELYGLEKSKELKNNRKVSQLGRIKSEETNRHISQTWFLP